MAVRFHGVVNGKDLEGTEDDAFPSGTTVRDVAERFAKGHEASFEEGATSGQGEKRLETRIVMLNEIGISPEKQLTTQVKEGDSVMIYLPVGGGWGRKGGDTRVHIMEPALSVIR